MIEVMVSLVSCTISMSLIMCIFIVMEYFGKLRCSPKFFYYLSVALAFGFAIPFRVTMQPFWMWGPEVGRSSSRIVTLKENVATAVQEKTLEGIGIRDSLLEIIFLVWLIVATGILIYYVVQHVKFTRTLARWTESDEEMFSDLECSMGLKIARCKCIATPMLVQLDQPTILLPCENYSQDELSMIVQHEQVHYIRKDWLLRGVMIIAVALHWFNPLVYVLARQMAKWCEISCDEEVTKNLSQNERYMYAITLLETVKRHSKQSMLSSFLCGEKHQVQMRLSIIVETKRRPFYRSVLAMCLLLVLVGTTVLSVPMSGVSASANEIGKTNAEINAEMNSEMRTALSEVFSNEFKESDFAGMTISYDEEGVPIVYDSNEDKSNSALIIETKRRLTGFYSTSDCDKDSLYFQVKKGSLIQVTDTTPGYKVAKVKYAGKTGYMKIAFNNFY